ncbi:hypothetical protein BH18CHL2_BH18CHL2_09200 [soil metagenome]
MGEVPVAFPPDRASAEVIASKLREEGIACRVDLGLAQTWEVPTRGNVTVFVAERHASRARKVLGVRERTEPGDAGILRLAITSVGLLGAVGIAAFVVWLMARP